MSPSRVSKGQSQSWLRFRTFLVDFDSGSRCLINSNSGSDFERKNVVTSDFDPVLIRTSGRRLFCREIKCFPTWVRKKIVFSFVIKLPTSEWIIFDFYSKNKISTDERCPNDSARIDQFWRVFGRGAQFVNGFYFTLKLWSHGSFSKRFFYIPWADPWRSASATRDCRFSAWGCRSEAVIRLWTMCIAFK